MFDDANSADAHAWWVYKHLNEFTADPTNFWALSTGLDSLRLSCLKGQLSDGACEALMRAAEDAADVAETDSKGVLAKSFDAVSLLVRAWGAAETIPAGASILGTRRDPRNPNAKRWARILQNFAHSRSLFYEMTNDVIVLPNAEILAASLPVRPAEMFD